MLLHAADHVRQGLEVLPPDVRINGAVLLIVTLAALPVTLRGRAMAPRVATALGVLVVAAVTSGHLAPWGAYSYPEVGVDAVSWAAMLIEVAAAAALAVVGLIRMRGPRVPAHRAR